MAATATRKSAEPQTDRVLSRRVLVTIRRDQTTLTPRVVWAHEVPVLQVIHGEDEVKEIDPAGLDEGYSAKPSADMLAHNKRQDPILPPSQTNQLGWVFVGNPEGEFNRLEAAYGRHADVPISNAERVYGRFSAGLFATIVGRPTLDDLPDAQLRDLILSWGHVLPVATYDSDNDERKTAEKAWAEFNSLPHAALVKLAEETGVQLG